MIDKQRCWESFEFRYLLHHFRCDHRTRIVHAGIGHEVLDRRNVGFRTGATLVVQTNDLQTELTILVLQLNEQWHFLTTGWTPRSPDVNDADLSFRMARLAKLIVAKADLFAVDISELEVEWKSFAVRQILLWLLPQVLLRERLPTLPFEFQTPAAYV